MTLLQRIIREFRFWDDCRDFGLGIWQCPRFLFVVMGVITIFAMVITHLMTVNYAEPEFVIVSVVIVAIIIFVVGNAVVRSFEKMASANRMKVEFISIVSHQLRTPLSSLKWSLNLLQSGRIGEIEGKQLEHIRIMKDSNDRMIRLVNEFLTISRLEKGTLFLRKEEFDFMEVVNRAMETISYTANTKEISIELENLLTNKANIYADKKYISIVVDNLLDNAVRYSNGKSKIKIQIKTKDKYVYFQAKDKGVGIPKNEQEYIFGKFFRTRNSMRHQTEGSGIGLYASKALVELHKGEIDFTSREGEGSTFWFRLPIKA